MSTGGQSCYKGLPSTPRIAECVEQRFMDFHSGAGRDHELSGKAESSLSLVFWGNPKSSARQLFVLEMGTVLMIS